MKKQAKRKFRTNTFYHMANEYRKLLTDESEIEKIDMTDVFFKELDYMIDNGELVNLSIMGQVRKGKSTEGMAVGIHIFEKLKNNGHRKKSEQFGMGNVARDDQEYSKMMRNPKLSFNVIVTDESNELEKGGENSTVESQLQRVFSDVQAGRYVHRVSCSPKEMIDNNSDIVLEIVSVDKEMRVSHNKLYYRLSYGGQEIIQLLGYVNIPVGKLIKNWEDTVKMVYFKVNKTKKDEELIKRYAKKDFYVEYMIKKYEKMDLITKEGIFRPRLLDYAGIIINVVDRLKKLTKMSGLINQNIVRNYVKIRARDMRIPMSIIGEELASREVMGLLDLYKGFHRISNKIVANDNALDSGKIQIDEHKDKQHLLLGMRGEILDSIKIQEEELKRYEEINARYNKHLEFSDE